MSRSQRREQIIGKVEHPRFTKPNKEETRAFVMRAGRRALIAKGLIMNPATRPEKYSFLWEYDEEIGTVYADTKSEARALIKKALGFSKNKRLPKEVRIARSLNIEHARVGEQVNANLRAIISENPRG